MKINMLLISLLTTIVIQNANAQKVDTLIESGTSYYIYPFKAKISVNDVYWGAVKDEKFFQDYNNYFDLYNGDAIFNRAAFSETESAKKLIRLQAKLMGRWDRLRKNGARHGRRFNKAVRSNPYELFNSHHTMSQDLLPPFEAIPDGKYVQLFNDVCVIDKDGMCQENTRIIAGYFTIKNNVPDGEVVWLSPRGDTLKTGAFDMGERIGEWEYKEKHAFIERGKWAAKPLQFFKKNHYYQRSLFIDKMTYRNGILNGPFVSHNYFNRVISGQYNEGVRYGEWSIHEGELAVERITYASSEDTIISKKPIIRPLSFTEEREQFYFFEEDVSTNEDIPLDLSRRYQMPEFPGVFYEIYFGKQEDIELEGESNNSHSVNDSESMEYDMYGDYDSFGNTLEDTRILDPVSGEYFLRSKLVDSLGVRSNYTGTYERYYSNGQLFFKYEFENGELVCEDTIYWDNGTPYDIVTKIPDSNQWLRRVFDRNGVKYDGMIYDSLGGFLGYEDEINAETPESNEVIIDGLAVDELMRSGPGRDDYEGFIYSIADSLVDSLVGNVVLNRLWTKDTTICVDSQYDVEKRQISTKYFNVLGDEFLLHETNFTENFGGWIGSFKTLYSDLELNATISGVLKEGMGNDTIPQRNILSPNWLYMLTVEQSISRNGSPFTGKIEIGKKKGLTQIKTSNNKIVLKNTTGGRFVTRREERAIKKLVKGGKPNKKMAMESMLMIGPRGRTHLGASLLSDLASTLLMDRRAYNSYRITSTGYKINNIEGYLEFGKPHGLWTSYDKNRKIISSLTFLNGEANGEMQMYGYQSKRSRKSKKVSYSDMLFYEESSTDTLPDHDVRYLKYLVNFKNGQREGKSFEYDWMGNLVSESNYVNDLQNGYALIRKKDAYFEASYKDGLIDGYLKQYLTLEHMDTILIYDVNFQHGLLNGESRAYHTNGRLAKRGFFLDSKPIDDYEVYDTLGVKYHYIKFKYGTPIEEKIWEENQLSIRYQFDWKDSIGFSPEDITFTESLQSLLIQREYQSVNLKDRYYGRPRLLNKQDVSCIMTKYFPNDTVARKGTLFNTKKIGEWKFYNYDGIFLYQVNYFDSIIQINDSIKFKIKGILTDYNDHGDRLYSSYIIEKFEKYDCTHTDHYETRQLITIDVADSASNRMNGYVQNFYDNGTIQSEGQMKGGIPTDLWKFYDPYGNLNKMGTYRLGKRHGRWLEGDLAKKKYLGEICMNPNLPNLEKEKKYQENLLDIIIVNYKMGRQLNTQYYDIDMNRFSERQLDERTLEEMKE